MLINIIDNFEARQIYFKAIFYSKDIGRNESEFVNYSADKINHSWEECTIKIEENKIRLKLYTPHDEKMNKQFGKEMDCAPKSGQIVKQVKP